MTAVRSIATADPILPPGGSQTALMKASFDKASLSTRYAGRVMCNQGVPPCHHGLGHFNEYNGGMTRAELHELLDSLPDSRLEDAWRRLAELVDDPILSGLMLAPTDDEPLTEDQAARLDRRGKSAALGKTVSTEGLTRRLGL